MTIPWLASRTAGYVRLFANGYQYLRLIWLYLLPRSCRLIRLVDTMTSVASVASVASMPPMHEEMHQGTGEEDQKWQRDSKVLLMPDHQIASDDHCRGK